MGKWSVIVPTYRRGEALRRCLESLRAEAAGAEIVVVEDGSPVRQQGMVEEFGGRYVWQENAGPAAARNRGAELAQGEWLAFVDDDCRVGAGWLTAYEAAARETPGDLLGGRVVNGLPENWCAEAAQSLIDAIAEYTREKARGAEAALAPFFTSNNVAVRRDLFWEVGGFDTRLPLAAAEDREFCREWLRRGGRLRQVAGAVVQHEHDLTPGKLLRQQWNYGRGAVQARRLRAEAGLQVEGWDLYWRMLSHPWQREGVGKAAVMSLLIGAGQVSMVAGAVREKWGGPR